MKNDFGESFAEIMFKFGGRASVIEI